MTTYFVKNAPGDVGNDALDGLSDANAWATLSKVNGFTFAAGDTIQFKRGSTWRENLTCDIAGASGNPVTYRDYGTGALPIISGADLHTSGWTADAQANTWWKTLGTAPLIVTFNGTRGTPVLSKAAVISPFQWFWDSAATKLYVFSVGNPATTYTLPGVEAGVRNTPVTVSAANWNTLLNLQISHGNEQGSLGALRSTFGLTGLRIDNCLITNNAGRGVFMNGVHDQTTIFNTEISYCGAQGIWHNQLLNTNQLFDGIHVHHNGLEVVGQQAGVEVQIKSGEMKNFLIHDNVGTGFYEGDLNVVTSLLIHDGVAHTNGNHGISVKSSATIYNNTIYGNGWANSVSAGGILCSGQNGASGTIDWLIHHNVIYENSPNARGIYQIQGGTGVALNLEIYHNTVWSNDHQGIRIENDLASLNIRNNIVGADDQVAVQMVTTQTAATIDRNLLFRTDASTSIGSYANVSKTWAQWQALGFDTTGFNTDPLFTNAAADDYTLQATSPARNAGVTITGINDDFFGTAPDIGALEFSELNAPVFDASSFFLRDSETDDPTSFTHTPVGTPRAIAVWIGQRLSSTDHIVSVTYGGVPMTRVVRAVDSGGEVGASDWWFLGAGIPTGPQTVVVDLDSATADDMRISCYSFTADNDTEIVDSDGLSENRANPQVTLQFGGRNCVSMCGLFTADNLESDVTDIAGQTRLESYWTGTSNGWVISKTTTASATDTTLGYTIASTGCAFTAIAFAEVVTVAAHSGSGSPVATLSAFAHQFVEASLTFIGSSTAVKTLSAFTSGAAAAMGFSTAGAAVKTLSAFASSAASLVFSALGVSARRISAFASGVVNNASTLGPIRRHGKGGGSHRILFQDALEPEKPRKRKRAPLPVPDVPELAPMELELPTFAPPGVDPAFWQLLRSMPRLPTAPEPQPEAPAGPQMSVEDQLLHHFLEMITGSSELPPISDDDAPFHLVRFLRQGKGR